MPNKSNPTKIHSHFPHFFLFDRISKATITASSTIALIQNSEVLLFFLKIQHYFIGQNISISATEASIQHIFTAKCNSTWMLKRLQYHPSKHLTVLTANKGYATTARVFCSLPNSTFRERAKNYTRKSAEPQRKL